MFPCAYTPGSCIYTLYNYTVTLIAIVLLSVTVICSLHVNTSVCLCLIVVLIMILAWLTVENRLSNWFYCLAALLYWTCLPRQLQHSLHASIFLLYLYSIQIVMVLWPQLANESHTTTFNVSISSVSFDLYFLSTLLSVPINTFEFLSHTIPMDSMVPQQSTFPMNPSHRVMCSFVFYIWSKHVKEIWLSQWPLSVKPVLQYSNDSHSVDKWMRKILKTA